MWRSEGARARTRTRWGVRHSEKEGGKTRGGKEGKGRERGGGKGVDECI